MSYPDEPIGGGNPYYMCSACHRSAPEISCRGHYSDCSWVSEQMEIKENQKLSSDLATANAELEKCKKALGIAIARLKYYENTSQIDLRRHDVEVIRHDNFRSGRGARQALREIEEVLK